VKNNNSLQFSTSSFSLVVRKSSEITNYHHYRSLYGRSEKRFTGQILDQETGLYYYGARYLDPRTSRWLSGDPAMYQGDYLPSAPINDEAKKRNQNLPGMGGIYNIVNMHVYHYAGNNPIRYVDPDGRDIYNITFFGVGAKVNVGGGITFGIAFDDKGQFATSINLNVGMGIEATIDTPITPSFTVTKGSNISDLPSIGPYRYETSTSVTASVVAGIILDLATNEIVGGSLGSIGGGVDANLTIYFDFNKAADIVSQMSNETKQSFSRGLESIKDSLPTEYFLKLQNLFNIE